MGNVCEPGLTDEEKRQLKLQRKHDKVLTDHITQSELEQSKVLKLLLLGPGSSGKSTLLKQMIKIYGSGFSEAERRFYTQIIYNNIIDSMCLLLQHCHRFGELDKSYDEAKKIVLDCKSTHTQNKDFIITEEFLAPQIRQLWSERLIKVAYEHGPEFHLTESCKYFFDKIDEVSKFGYIPSEADILRCRAPTTGIVETTFSVDGNEFKMLDVGGQRSERRKWIHCFENVTAVLFVAAISEYNQVLFEDESQNRLMEAFTLFADICNGKWFRKTSLILFLNKRDLFAEKITRVPFTDYFPDYHGNNTYEDLTSWIESQFLRKNRSPQTKKIYSHVTCATDTGNIRAVFYAVKNIIIRKNLERFGLL